MCICVLYLLTPATYLRGISCFTRVKSATCISGAAYHVRDLAGGWQLSTEPPAQEPFVGIVWLHHLPYSPHRRRILSQCDLSGEETSAGVLVESAVQSASKIDLIRERFARKEIDGSFGKNGDSTVNILSYNSGATKSEECPGATM